MMIFNYFKHNVFCGLIFTTILFSCKKQNQFLNIEGAESITLSNDKVDVLIPISTNIGNYEFRLDNGSWLTGKVTEEGIILTAETNVTVNTRNATLRVVSLKYPELNKQIDISQLGSYLSILPEIIESIPALGGSTQITVESNLNSNDWSVSLVNAGTWATLNEQSGLYTIVANQNIDLYPRNAYLELNSQSYPSLNKRIPIFQLGTDANIKALVFSEDWKWLPSVNNLPLSKNIWTAANEVRLDVMPNKNGWNGTIFNNEILIFSRDGFIKSGTARTTADLITPKLSSLGGAEKILVSFKAHAFMDFNGTVYDDNEMNVVIKGPGIITEIKSIGGQLASPSGKSISKASIVNNVAKFTIGNYNNPETSAKPNWIANYNHWDPVYSERRFIVSGASFDTQIQFVFGPSSTVGSVSVANRLGFGEVLILSLNN